MFDSLNRHLLSAYGCDWTVTPNFKRLAERTVRFDSSYVCSMPCMPARRDLHTGRPNFLHRSWGPLEPWDDSVPRMLREAGVHTHIVTDHQHYWEEGAGGNYMAKYSTHAMVRGQEGDPYCGMIPPPGAPPGAIGRNALDDAWHAMDRVNRSQVAGEQDMPIAQTFANGMDFIRRHARQDNLVFDWPSYGPVRETPEEVALMRHNYAALLTLCDAQVGRVIDLMDELDLWKDTMLAVWTDHGFCLGEHDCWAKCWLPFYEEIARTPFFVWDPRCGVRGESRSSLVQPAIDLGPTLLEFFGLEPTERMLGKPLRQVIERDEPLRETAIFGIFGGQVNITDGRYVYMRGPANADNQPLNEYTLMPSHMRAAFAVDELQDNQLAEPFSFMRGIRPLRIPGRSWKFTETYPERGKTLLFDLQSDPGQLAPVDAPEIEARMIRALRGQMEAADAPAEQFRRLGL